MLYNKDWRMIMKRLFILLLILSTINIVGCFPTYPSTPTRTYHVPTRRIYPAPRRIYPAPSRRHTTPSIRRNYPSHRRGR